MQPLPNIIEELKAKLGREPTKAEFNAEVRRITKEARRMILEGRNPKLRVAP